MKKKYADFRVYQDYHVFTLLCMKYFFFSEAGTNFSPDTALEYLTDGANDGGIDAIFNDENTSENDLIVVQSKYYTETDLKIDNVIAELSKINDTLKKLEKNKIEDYNEKLVTAYRNATSSMQDDASVRIVFFTSYQPKNKRERNKFDRRIQDLLKGYEVEINFANDIESQIEICNSGKAFVEHDKLEIDEKGNFLKYEDSVIVNVSAKSLQDLQNRRRNGLLGMNLRYYVKQKAVDEGIRETIKKEPENFWYKNNGILIICDNFNIDGKEIKLDNFSIVNGGQTTNRIGNLDIDEDFYLQCKVVKSKGIVQKEKDKFALEIAEATNSQKPIKKADLKANTPEQIRLREKLSHCGVYYITKKGDKAPKQYTESYQIATMDKVGKLGLAGLLQMPGSARNHAQRMFQDDNYYSIFGENTKEQVIADLLKISYYYENYLKLIKKDSRGFDKETVLPMIKNGRTYQISCIAFLSKIIHEEFNYDEEIIRSMNDTDNLKAILRRMDKTEKIIFNKLDDEERLFYKIFDIIGDEVLGYLFENELEKAKNDQKTLAPSDYLKSDNNYYKNVIKRLWSRYHNNKELQNIINLICGK